MSQYEKVFRIVGPIIGFALLYYVLTGAAGFLQQGQLALANQATTAAEAAAAGDAAAAGTAAVTETAAVAATPP